MTKEQFISALSNAKQDEDGRLYLEGKYNNKIYFGIITTICEDLFKDFGCEGDEIYDRHFWNDDTLECHIINNDSFDLKQMIKEKLNDK